MQDKLVMSTNEALALGAIEAGVNVVTAYPGEPISSIVDTLFAMRKGLNMHIEWAINEKVAYELALGASFTGSRALVCVKHVGFNWLIDPLVASAYSGIRGGLVIVDGDDPSATASTHEEDVRYISKLSEVPLLEPSSPQEAIKMIKFAFNISEEFELPVIIRVITRLCLEKGEVVLEKARYSKASTKAIAKGSEKGFKHTILHEKNLRLKKISGESEFNRMENGVEKDLGIIVSGNTYSFLKRILVSLQLDLPILKIGFVNPTPYTKILEFSKQVRDLLVVEEVQPFLEEEVKLALQQSSINIFGKYSNHLPWANELNPLALKDAIERILNKSLKMMDMAEAPKPSARYSRYTIKPCLKDFHPQCPHLHTINSIKKVIKQCREEVIIVGDVGCMTLDLRREDSIIDTIVCMGASPSITSGIILGGKKKAIAIIGDSSFYHNGLLGLMNAIHTQTPLTLIIVDNMITAQTGFQPNIGTASEDLEIKRALKIESILNALNVRYHVLNPVKEDKLLQEIIINSLNSNQCTVIIARGKCPLAEVAGAYKSFNTVDTLGS
jgi:indolepyruvate ferredoxin oxidoreductase alpha subunit